MNIQGGNLAGFTAHSYYNGCLPTLRPPGKRSGIILFAGAANSSHPSKTWVQRYLPSNTWASRSQKEEVHRVYNEVYQLKRVSGAEPCDGEMAENIHQDILNSVKECLHHRQDNAQPMEEINQRSNGTSRPDPWSEFQWKDHATYDHFWDTKRGHGKQP